MRIFNKSIKSDHTTKRRFNYTLGKVNLDFTLRTDIKEELKDFKLLLTKALSEVTDELNKL